MGGDVRVTVVNETEAIADLIDELMRERGQRTTRLLDGAMSLDALRESGPDLVFLGLRGRELGDGWELLADIRGDNGLAAVPVVLCTGDLRALRERETDLAGDPLTRVLEKPFSLEDFDCTIEGALRP